MQFRGKVKAYSLMGEMLKDGTYLPGSYWKECSLDHALRSSAIGGCAKVTCTNWKVLKKAWKHMEEYYSDEVVHWERIVDDRHVMVKPVLRGYAYGFVTFSVEVIGD